MNINKNDPYFLFYTCVTRLLNEYKKHNSLIVAFDLDGTVNDFHSDGFNFPKMIKLLQKAKEHNCYLFCFTAHPDEEFVKDYLVKNNIPFDSINDSPVKQGMGLKKPFYNILLDDRAGLKDAYEHLSFVFRELELENLCKTVH